MRKFIIMFKGEASEHFARTDYQKGLISQLEELLMSNPGIRLDSAIATFEPVGGPRFDDLIARSRENGAAPEQGDQAK